MASAWKSTDDFKNDLWSFSEIIDDDDESNGSPPPSILQYQAIIGANRNASIFDTQYSLEPVTYLSTGRGRGGISQMFKPGSVNKDDIDEEHTVHKYLREVSGLGYSNELIEKSFKKSTPLPNEEFCNVDNDTGDECFSLHQVSDKLSNNSLLSTQKKHTIGSSSNSVIVSSSPIKEVPIVRQPPPLSVIMNQGKKNNKNDKESTVKIKECALNPEASEFQFRYSEHHDETIKTEQWCNGLFKSFPNSHSGSGSGDDNENISSENGSLNGGCDRNHDNVSEYCNGSFEANGVTWMQKKNRQSFDIKSVNDFPPL